MTKKKSPRGRKTVRTDEVRDKLVRAIKMGSTHKLACQYAGISHDTFYKWLNDDADFSYAIKEAEGAGAVELLALIKKQAHSGNWQAGAWILERRYPAEYGRRTVDVNHSGQVALTWADFIKQAQAEADDDAPGDDFA